MVDNLSASIFSDTSTTRRHGVFDAYLNAYNSHEDIVLSPEYVFLFDTISNILLLKSFSDLWLMITIYFAKYVNDNAEKLRSLFVSHEGKIKLTIEQMQPEPE